MEYEKKLKYHDLMEELRSKILNGEIRPGEKLPSENMLSASYQVSRQTVRKALQMLEEEGFDPEALIGDRFSPCGPEELFPLHMRGMEK